MGLKVISYDLGQQETASSYKELIDYIKGLSGSWCKPLESFWIVDTEQECSTIRDGAKPYLDDNDKIFVFSCPFASWASIGLDKVVAEWLRARM